MARIVLIDDEHGPVDYYVQALVDSGHEVAHLDTVDKVFEYLQNPKPADLFVVDIMMPTLGRPELKDAAEGLATGIVFWHQIRERFPGVPIIILTSVANPEILEGLPFDNKTQIESKIDTLPFELAEVANKLLKS
ncbi:MAG: response regulator [Verrucomicrobiota bacterium]|jgi:CheY-like chemotaxis protein